MQKQKRPRKLSVYKMIPNMITLTALAAGMTAVKFAIAERWEAAVIAIVIAAFMDAFDGAAARLLKAQSKLGAELDSLSDFICFGVAPALVLYLWALDGEGRWAWPVALIFTMSVALRLARFNIAADDKEEVPTTGKYFTGIPAPIGAGLSILPMIVSFQVEADVAELMQNPFAVGGWSVIVAAMMVSNIPTFSSKQIRIPYKMKIPALAAFGILIAGLINDTWPTLTLMGVIYLFSLPFGARQYARQAQDTAQHVTQHDDDDDV